MGLLLMCCSLVVVLCYIVAGILFSTSLDNCTRTMIARGLRVDRAALAMSVWQVNYARRAREAGDASSQVSVYLSVLFWTHT